MSWEEITEQAREGRRIQARYLQGCLEIHPVGHMDKVIEKQAAHIHDKFNISAQGSNKCLLLNEVVEVLHQY